MENPTYKEIFFGCPDHERKCILLTLMFKPKNLKKVWDFLANFSFGMNFVILFCLSKTHYKSFFKRYLFAFLYNIYFVENKYVMRELLYNIKIYIT